MVRIIPIDDSFTSGDVWEERERFVSEYGLPDFVEPERAVEVPRDPFAE